MNLSNYPPGVTGNEPQIAGYPEVELEQTEECCIYLGTDEDSNDVYCTFEGKVVVTIVGYAGEAMKYWTCPKCGFEHEDEVEDDTDL